MTQDTESRAPWRAWFTLLALLASLCGLTALMVGCGGAGGGDVPGPNNGGGSRARGRVAVSVRWPERTRLVPVAAQSIRVRLLRGANVEGDRTLERPAEGGGIVTTAEFENIEVGDLTMTASAHPEAGAQGVAQAQGAAPVTVVAGERAEVRLVMDSTIETVEITPAQPRFRVGEPVQLQAVARNAAGEVVLTAPDNLQWAVPTDSEYPALVLYLNGPGLIGANFPGQGRVTVTEAESGKRGETIATVGTNGSSSPPPTSARWSRFHGGPQNDGFVEQPAVTPRDNWVFQASPNDRESAPAAVGADGTVYIPYASGRLYARAAANAAPVWTFDRSAKLRPGPGGFGPPAVGPDEAVYVVGNATDQDLDPTSLYALRANGGPGPDARPRVVWEVPGAFVTASCPVVSEGGDRVYAVRRSELDTFLDCYDAASGDRLWSKRAVEGDGDATVLASPALGRDGAVYMVTTDGDLVAFEAGDGADRFRVRVGRLPNYVSSPVVGPDGTVYVGGPSGHLYARDPFTGAERWRFPFGNGPITGTPAIDPSGVIYVPTMGNGNGPAVFALDTNRAGEEGWAARWAFRPTNRNEEFGLGASPAVVRGGRVWIGSRVPGGDFPGRLYGLNTSDGQAVVARPLSFPVGSPITVGQGGTVLFADDSGIFNALGP